MGLGLGLGLGLATGTGTGTGTGDGEETSARSLRRALREARPGGLTPLLDHVLEIHRALSGMAPLLRSRGQRVAVVLATDGLPTDPLSGRADQRSRDDLLAALRLLGGLPVWLVVRLCTAEGNVVAYYSDLDQCLEADVEVLDDLLGEAREVRRHNPWLTYGLVLHRMREWGHHDRAFDLIDERPLTRSELWDFCSMLFGEGGMDGCPDPDVDWGGFLDRVGRLARAEERQWDPITGRSRPWIDVREMRRVYGNGYRYGCGGSAVVWVSLLVLGAAVLIAYILL